MLTSEQGFYLAILLGGLTHLQGASMFPESDCIVLSYLSSLLQYLIAGAGDFSTNPVNIGGLLVALVFGPSSIANFSSFAQDTLILTVYPILITYLESIPDSLLVQLAPYLAGGGAILGPFVAGPLVILLGVGFGTVGAGTLLANWVLSVPRSLIRDLKRKLRQTQAKHES